MAGQPAAYSRLGQLQLACRLAWLASCHAVVPQAGQTAPAQHVGQLPEVALPRWLAEPSSGVPPAGRGIANTASWPAKGATPRPTGWPSAAQIEKLVELDSRAARRLCLCGSLTCSPARAAGCVRQPAGCSRPPRPRRSTAGTAPGTS